MKIDQTRLLLVTGVLTASLGLCGVMGGCSSKSEETADPASQDQDANAPSPGPEDDTPPGSSGSSGTSGTSGTSGQDAGGNKDAGTKDGGEGGTPAACLDDSAPAAQPACPGTGQCQNACTTFATAYKKGVSADIRKCLTIAICQAGTATCVDKALAKTCADPTATAFCTPMVTGCKGANAADTITQPTCEAIAKGLTAAGRNTLKTCFENELNCGDCPAKMK